MGNTLEQRLAEELGKIADEGNLRSLTTYEHRGKYIMRSGYKMLNLSSNDYLGFASDDDFQQKFVEEMAKTGSLPTSSSSRLLSGNFREYDELEGLLASAYGAESALVLNCGYHANTGILAAVSNKNTLVLADKLVHASIIDGLKLCEAKYVRFRHNDYEQLEQLVVKYATEYGEIIIVVESVYSMDGDVADLRRLVALKKLYPQIMLYVDEAHGVGCFGTKGLGVAERQGCLKDIDILVGTFGKALASVGAFVVCSSLVREYLINKMRPLIFTTAMPPAAVAWSIFTLKMSIEAGIRRKRLTIMENEVQKTLEECGIASKIESQIIPIVVGDAHETLRVCERFKSEGFCCSAVRPPTVPQGTSRLRMSLMATLDDDEVEKLCKTIKKIFIG